MLKRSKNVLTPSAIAHKTSPSFRWREKYLTIVNGLDLGELENLRVIRGSLLLPLLGKDAIVELLASRGPRVGLRKNRVSTTHLRRNYFDRLCVVARMKVKH